MTSPLETVRVTELYQDAGNKMVWGTVKFTPVAERMTAAEQVILLPLTVEVKVRDGAFAADLVPNDAPGLLPTGWSYLVQEEFGGEKMEPYSIQVTADMGPTVRLSSLAPLGTPVGPAPISYVRTINGETGDVTADKDFVGLSNVDNTSDASKPISTATAAALAGKMAKGELMVNVRDYGATGDGVTDDTAFINACLAAVQPGAKVFFPTGTYLVSKDGTGNMIRVGKQRLHLLGASRDGTVIKVKNSTGDYASVVTNLSAVGSNVNVDGLRISDLTIDQNSQNQTINPASNGPLFNGSPRYGLRIWNGNDIVIDNVGFSNADCVNCISGNGVELTQRWTIRNCLFSVIGSGTYHDHSTIFYHGRGIMVTGNVFLGGGNAATAAIETHGPNQQVTGNMVRDYQIGMHITGVSAYSDNILVQGNLAFGVGIGVYLWAQNYAGLAGPALKGCIVDANQVEIDYDRWYNIGGGFRAGVMLDQFSTATARDVKITNNLIRFKSYVSVPTTTDNRSAGILWYRNNTTVIAVGTEDDGIDISRNQIEGSLSAGIFISPNIKTRRLTVEGNRIINPGRGAAIPAYRCGVFVSTLALGLEDASISNNSIVDTAITQLVNSGINSEFTNTVINGRMLDNTLRCDNGANVTVHRGHASGAWYLRSTMATYLAPVGAWSAGSSIVETSTGAERRQTVTPAGTTWTNVIDSKITKGTYSVNVKDYGALGDGVADDTTAIRTAVATGAKRIYFPPGNYKVNVTYATNLVTFAGVNDIFIDAGQATITNTTEYPFKGSFTTMFWFDNCKNIRFELGNYVGFTLVDPNTELGYKGVNLVRLINGCDGAVIRATITNARYGVQSGDYENPALGNCKNIDIKLRTFFVGYPVALYLAEGIKLDIDADDSHRSAYLAGCIGVTAVSRWRNQYVVDNMFLITDAITGAGTSRGSKNMDVQSIDKGSTIFQNSTVCAGISLSRVDPGIVFENIKIRVYTRSTNTVSSRVGGFKIMSDVTPLFRPEYLYNWDAGIIIRNVTISGVLDHSAQTTAGCTSGEISIRAFDAVHSPTTYGTIENLVFEDLHIRQPGGPANPSTLIAPLLAGAGATFNRVYAPETILNQETNNVAPVNFRDSTFKKINQNVDVSGGSGIKSSVINSTLTEYANSVSDSSLLDASGGTSIGGAQAIIRQKQMTLSLSGSTSSLANFIPAGSMILGVQGIISQAITGATGFQVGVSGFLTRYADITATAAGTQFSVEHSTEIAPRFYASAADLVLTPKTSNFTSGAIKLVLHYMDFTPPTI